ncbi:DUF4262 domain-containing protein [Erythrobacter sp. SDW2]|uniref:DUF4262 domain-containing protein n=1 Tax=Erythrobacter sp. SDW2 TaxID=2907154 RepID=UPI001F1E94F6|nr:DUF4262 domain-containing protein [Erythrobacter sp. SDW2]UIP06481.1 DUF4262 domain-containing protein [Erythrobacter sp. SDW2]
MTETTELTTQHKAILENIEQFGLSVMHVAAEDPRAPSYSFSVGFEHSLAQPEVLVYGLDRNLAQSMINEVFRQCKEEGLELVDGQAIGNLIEGYDCMVRPIDDPRGRAAHFGYAIWFQQRSKGDGLNRAVQIVWPDPKTRAFPWQDGCGSDIRGWQVQLYPAGEPK